jgi:tetratricopeptide (TPR) repeat protein
MLMEDTTDGQMLDALDEALSARIIEELPTEVGLYQFTHAQMQETMVSELSSNRLVRMHARIAEALEAHYGGAAEDHAAELVEHFAEAETVLGTEKLVNYSVLAGNLSLSAFAHQDAQKYFEIGINALEPNEHSLRAGEVYLGFGKALSQTLGRNELQGSVDSLDKAFRIFESLGEKSLAVNAALVEVPHAHGPTGLADMTHEAMKYVPSDSPEFAELAAKHVQWKSFETGSYAIDVKDAALKSIGQIKNIDLEVKVLGYLSSVSAMQCDYDLHNYVLERAHELMQVASESKSLNRLAENVAHDLVTKGEFSKASELAVKTLDSSMRLGAKFEQVLAYSTLGFIAAREGRFEDALKFQAEGLALAPQEWRVRSGTVHIHILRGDLEKATQALQEGDPNQESRGLAFDHVLAMKFLGDSPYDDYVFDRMRERNLTSGKEPGPSGMAIATLAAASSLGLIDDDPVELYKQSLSMTLGPTWELNIPHKLILGDLAHVIGKQTEAEQHYREFLQDSRQSRWPDWIAFGCVSYSEYLLDRNAPGDHEKAIELQDEAISIATELGMKPLLERVLAKREILKA